MKLPLVLTGRIAALRIAPSYARALGVPVILSNRTGPLLTPLPAGMGDLVGSFPGLSTIVEEDASVKAKLGGAKGVTLAPAARCRGRHSA